MPWSHCPTDGDPTITFHWTTVWTGCNIAFTADWVTIQHNNTSHLTRTINSHHQTLGIGHQPPRELHTHMANTSIGSATPANLVAFVHVALFSPALSTLAESLWHGHLPEFNGLTLQWLCQHPQSSAMIQGCIDQEQQHKHSTIPKQSLPLDSISHDDNDFLPAPSDGACIHFCYTVMLEPTGQIYTNQTGKFVTLSSTGNNYILILYYYDKCHHCCPIQKLQVQIHP